MDSFRVRAQDRMSDKDLERTLNNLKSDAKTFSSTFGSALGKSAIRKTSQEKDAKTLVENFNKQSDAVPNKFKKDQHPENGPW